MYGGTKRPPAGNALLHLVRKHIARHVERSGIVVIVERRYRWSFSPTRSWMKVNSTCGRYHSSKSQSPSPSPIEYRAALATNHQDTLVGESTSPPLLSPRLAGNGMGDPMNRTRRGNPQGKGERGQVYEGWLERDQGRIERRAGLEQAIIIKGNGRSSARVVGWRAEEGTTNILQTIEYSI